MKNLYNPSPIFNANLEKFCAEYLACGDEVAAFREVFRGTEGYNYRTLKRDAKAFMMQREVAERLSLMSREALRMKRLDAKAILERIAQIAFADVTSIAKVRRVNCRHCWGKDFKRQWTRGEFDDLRAANFDEAQRKGVAFVEPEEPIGGMNFDSTRKPHPDCPECSGEGLAEIFIEDFDKISEDVRPLIASVEHTRYGIKVSFHSQTAALETLAKCFGLMQPEIAIQIVQQMMPANRATEVFEPVTIDQATEAYKRLMG